MTRTHMLDLLEKIRPLLKDDTEAQRLWQLWLVESRDGREWIEQLIEMEYLQLIRPLEKQVLLLPPPPKDVAKGKFEVGQVVYNEKELYPYGIPDETALLQHTAIFGRSGAGKTNLLFKILGEFSKNKLPFWILDWKRDYRPLLKQSSPPLVFTIGRGPSPFPFNPLIPPKACQEDLERHIGKVVDIIGRAFYVGHGVKALLARAFHAVLQKWKENPDNPITFQAALKWIREYNPNKNGNGRRTSDWRESTIRALEQLCMGQYGRCLNSYPGLDLEKLLGQSVIFELDGLTNDQKFFFTETLLLWLREHLLANLDKERNEKLRLVLVIEEAHNILKTGQERNVEETVLELTIRETRSLGMGVVLLDQTPAFINKVATSNVFTNINFSLQGRANVSTAADALLLDEDRRDYLGRLPVGMAVVRMQDHWMQPFLIKVPLMTLKHDLVTDKEVLDCMKGFQKQFLGVGYSGYSGDSRPESRVIPVISRSPNKGITDDEKNLLIHILKHPYVGMAGRYRELKVSTRKGSQTRESLETKGLVRVESINTGNAQVKLAELTRDGAEILKKEGFEVKLNGSKGSLEHKYWAHRVAEYYRTRGYNVTIEKDLGNGTRVDVEAIKGRERFAIEIHTGKSHKPPDLAKFEGRAYRIILVPTTPEAIKQCEASPDRNQAVVVPAGDF